MVNVGKYAIHGSYGNQSFSQSITHSMNEWMNEPMNLSVPTKYGSGNQWSWGMCRKTSITICFQTGTISQIIEFIVIWNVICSTNCVDFTCFFSANIPSEKKKTFHTVGQLPALAVEGGNCFFLPEFMGFCWAFKITALWLQLTLLCVSIDNFVLVLYLTKT